MWIPPVSANALIEEGRTVWYLAALCIYHLSTVPGISTAHGQIEHIEVEGPAVRQEVDYKFSPNILFDPIAQIVRRRSRTTKP